MLLRKTYSIVLGLYPPEFKAQFGEEMVAVFEQAVAQRRGRGDVSLFLFLVREILGLAAGAVRERGLHPRSRREGEHLTCPSNISGAERYLQIVSGRLITAIANHDFENARYYDEQDRKARELLARLRAQENEFIP